MIQRLIDPQKTAAALSACLGPLIRHAGWFGFFLFLAPVIGPRGYGLFTLALSGIAIAEALFARTASEALVGLPVLDERHLSTALVTTIVAGAAMSLMLYSVTGAIGAMVDEKAFSDIFRSLSLVPLLGALAAVPTAVLRRRGRDAPLLAASVAGLVAGGGAAVALAWAGAGPWSLVAQIVVQRFFECAVLWGIAGEHVGILWSRSHFAEFVGGFDLRALAAAWPVVARHGPCLIVGLSLGPTAAGLYLLAARLAEALVEIGLGGPAAGSTARMLPRALHAVLAAIVGYAVLPIIVPPLLDPRWWGAIAPAQILLLGAIPAALGLIRATLAENSDDAPRWRLVQTLGGIVAVVLAVRAGLGAVAAAALGSAALVALASLWPLYGRLKLVSRHMFGAAERSLVGGFVAAFLMFLLADPVGLALAPVPALCLLAASSRLCYLAICG